VLGNKLESLDVKRMRADARRALDAVGLGIDEWNRVAGLPVGHMQFIEIARGVDKERLKLLIFDEPPRSSPKATRKKLLDIMRGLAQKGHAILFITHRLDEVLAVADRITVLRDGEVVGTPDPKTTTVVRIAELMVGRPAAVKAARRFFAPTTEPAMGIESLSVDMPESAWRRHARRPARRDPGHRRAGGAWEAGNRERASWDSIPRGAA